MARRDTTALIKRLKKRLNRARMALKVDDPITALEEIDYAILDLEAEAEFEATEVHGK